MDKLLKPKDLDVLPTDSNAASVFKYWIATFESFLQAVETGQAASDPSVELTPTRANMLALVFLVITRQPQ